MLLITGPPGSGKTSFVVERFRAAVRSGSPQSILLVPTTTLAEHLRNQLAREGFVFSPSAIGTFSKFVHSIVPDFAILSAAALEILIQQLLQSDNYPSFRRVREFRGFTKTLASAIGEVSAAGITPTLLNSNEVDTEVLRDFSRLFGAIESECHRRGLVLPGASTREAANRLAGGLLKGISEVFFCGFFSFTPGEIKIIESIAGHANVVVTAPDWEGAKQTIVSLKAIGFEEQRIEMLRSPVPASLVAPPTLGAEVTEIVRRILLEHEQGRPFRDIGVIVRSEEPYVAALRASFARFGIPARFYFALPLRTHPVVEYLYGLMQAMLGGWDHQETLAVLKREGSPLALSDRFDFQVRAQLPGRGLAALAAHSSARFVKFFDQLSQLDTLRDRLLLPSQWVQHFCSLRGLFIHSQVTDQVAHERALLWRERSAALAAFETAAAETADVLGQTEKVSCAAFLQTLDIVLESAALRVPDHRRDVVHVLDAFEARQWKLPLIFLCGLLERQFPKYHSEHPILPDSFRQRMQSKGYPLRTSRERQTDEQFLFDVARARATDAVVLSYPKLNSKGEPNLPAFFLDKIAPLERVNAIPARRAPGREHRSTASAHIRDEELQAVLKRETARIGATTIETFLQCPYLFFARRILNLKEAPSRPWERLDPLLQGTIAHRFLKDYFQEDGQNVAESFARVFAETCRENNIPSGYRTEAVRLELLNHLENFVQNSQLPRGAQMLLEHRIEWQLDEETLIHGSIDRIAVDASGGAIIIDYKYKAKAGIDKAVKAHEAGTLVQGGLYLNAIAQHHQMQPAAMLYCGLKRGESLGGWRASEIGYEALRDLMKRSRDVTLDALVQIRGGRIEPRPADEEKCGYCAFSGICRIDARAASASGSGASL